MLKCLVLASVILTIGGAATAGELCDAAVAAVPGLACAEAPLGVALAQDPARAAQLARFAEAGEGRFRRHFGLEPGRYAVIEFTDRSTVPGHQQALKNAGFEGVLAMPSRQEYIESMTAATASAVERSVRARGLNEDQVANAVAQATAARGQMLTDEALTLQEADTVPHELGHGWYTAAFWPDQEGSRGSGHYGGPGPDWLDETAAILHEADQADNDHRVLFSQIYRGRHPRGFAGYPAETLLDLRAYLERDHPMKAMAASLTPGSGMVVFAVANSDAAKVGDGPLFYATGRMFADFLLDRTGDPAVFGSIGAAFGRGETLDQWLAAEGETRGLAGSVEGLDRLWRAWLEARFGPPAVTPAAT